MSVKVGLLYAMVVLALSLMAGGKAVRLPNSIEVCRRADDACLLRSAQKAIQVLKSGSAKLGMLPFDPLEITEMNIQQNQGAFRADLKFKNQLLRGLSDVDFKQVKGNFTNTTFYMELRCLMPLITLSGDYSVKGQALIVPVTGDGQNKMALDQLDGTIVTRGHVVKKDGEDFVHVDKLTLSMPSMKRLRINLSNLFNGDKALGDNMNTLLNENWEGVWKDMRSSFEEALGEVFEQIFKRIYSKVPYKNMHSY